MTPRELHRLERAAARLGVDHEPRPDWQQRVIDQIAAEARRRELYEAIAFWAVVIGAGILLGIFVALFARLA